MKSRTKLKNKILKHLKNKFSKSAFQFSDVFSSGGGFYHCCFLKDDKKIITAHQDSNINVINFEISYKDYYSIDEYFCENEEGKKGFSYEYEHPNYDKRIWAIKEEDL
tara:strand:+ start:39 stop:362 length:324 start_codon:yes stop_codon:yes gene_type:complete